MQNKVSGGTPFKLSDYITVDFSVTVFKYIENDSFKRITVGIQCNNFANPVVAHTFLHGGRETAWL